MKSEKIFPDSWIFLKLERRGNYVLIIYHFMVLRTLYLIFIRTCKVQISALIAKEVNQVQRGSVYLITQLVHGEVTL